MDSMATTPNSPTLTIARGFCDFAHSSSTLTLKGNHHDSSDLQASRTSTMKDAPESTADKPHSNKAVDSAHNSPLQSTVNLIVQEECTSSRADTVKNESTTARKKQPYDGLLMRPHPVDEEEDNCRQVIVRIVRRSVPLIKSKNWKALPVFYEDDEDEK